MIVKESNKYILKSKDGSKHLGTFNSREEALKREKQINFFKALEERKNERRTK